MATSYKKLWHILVDRELKKKDLQEMANLTHYQMTKLSRGENITTDIVGRICTALDVKADDITRIIIDDENYLPNILKQLWKRFSRDEIYQPNRYQLEIAGNHTDLQTIIVDDPRSNLQRRVYDAIFRILPEGFKIIKDMSTDDIVTVVATDELIADAWIEKANDYIAELSGK